MTDQKDWADSGLLALACTEVMLLACSSFRLQLELLAPSAPEGKAWSRGLD